MSVRRIQGNPPVRRFIQKGLLARTPNNRAQILVKRPTVGSSLLCASKESSMEGTIRFFLFGKLGPQERRDFVDRLKTDRDFLLQTVKSRRNLPVGELSQMPLSERAISLIKKMSVKIWGREFHPLGIRYFPDLEESHRVAIRLCQELIELGEAEDIALENQYRAEENIRRISKHEERFSKETALAWRQVIHMSIIGRLNPPVQLPLKTIESISI